MKPTHHEATELRAGTKSQLVGKGIFYFLMAVSLITTISTINSKYTSQSTELLLKNTLPSFNCTVSNQFFLRQYIYDCTEILFDEPITLVTHSIPYLRDYASLVDLTNHDIAGYFDTKNNDEKFEMPENDSYSPKLPSVKKMDLSEENYKDSYYILKNFVTGDAELEIDTNLLKHWNFYKLMTEKLRVHDKTDGPKILIFHTHAREKYKDGESVIDVGEALKKRFEGQYGIKTMHVTSEFYADDSGSVAGCYEIMEKSIKKILKENPSIEICIDIHRDGIEGTDKSLAEINNKQMAKLMFVNGLCMNRNLKGEIVKKENLQNPYLNENLAFSFQAQAMAYRYYPEIIKKIYFKEYRYSLHMKPMSLLAEIGNQNNTGSEACNTTEPLANIIAKVIQKD